MTISTETNKTGLITYTGAATYSGVITFAYPSTDDLKVYVIDNSGSGARTLLDGSGGTPDYTISGTDLIITAAGASTITALSYSNERLTVYREIAQLLQTSDFSNQGAFLPANIEAAFDFVTYAIQQQEEQLRRCIQIGPWDGAISGLADDEARLQAATLPTLVNGGVIYWNSASSSFEISGDVNVTDLATVAGISSDITTVANISANVTSVAGNAGNINIVAGSISNVNAVGSNIANVLSVDGNSTNINLVAGSIANVNTVAGSIANVNTVAGSIANVNTVAGINAEVTTVAGDSADIQTLAGRIDDGTIDSVVGLAATGFVQFDTLADLASNSLANFVNGSHVYVRGRSSNGDGAEGLFYYTSSDLSSLVSEGEKSVSAYPGSNTATVTAHGYTTGDAVYRKITDDSFVSAQIDPLYVNVIDANTVSLHTSYADALSDTSRYSLSGTPAVGQAFSKLLDPTQGYYVIPVGSGLDGSGGAWVRVVGDEVKLDWFCTGDNSTDDTVGIKAAFELAYASTLKMVGDPSKIYYLGNTNAMGSSSILFKSSVDRKVSWRDVTLRYNDSLSSARGVFLSGETFASGGAALTLASNVVIGATTVTLDTGDGASFAAGDLMAFYSTEDFTPNQPVEDPNKKAMYIRVASVSGDVVTLQSPAYRSFLAANAKVFKVQENFVVDFENVHVLVGSPSGSAPNYNGSTGIRIDYAAQGSRLVNVSADGFDAGSVEFVLCQNIKTDGVAGKNARATGSGYALSVAGCYNPNLSNTYGKNVRHIITLGTGGTGTPSAAYESMIGIGGTAVGVIGEDINDAPIDVHPGHAGFRFSNVSVSSGEDVEAGVVLQGAWCSVDGLEVRGGDYSADTSKFLGSIENYGTPSDEAENNAFLYNINASQGFSPRQGLAVNNYDTDGRDFNVFVDGFSGRFHEDAIKCQATTSDHVGGTIVTAENVDIEMIDSSVSDWAVETYVSTGASLGAFAYINVLSGRIKNHTTRDRELVYAGTNRNQNTIAQTLTTSADWSAASAVGIAGTVTAGGAVFTTAMIGMEVYQITGGGTAVITGVQSATVAEVLVTVAFSGNTNATPISSSGWRIDTTENASFGEVFLGDGVTLDRSYLSGSTGFFYVDNGVINTAPGVRFKGAKRRVGTTVGRGAANLRVRATQDGIVARESSEFEVTLDSTAHGVVSVSGGGSGQTQAAFLTKDKQGRGGGLFMHNEVDDQEWFCGRLGAGTNRWGVTYNSSTASHTDATADSTNYVFDVDISGNADVKSGGSYKIGGTQVVGARGATVADPAGGATVDAEARTAINALIDRLQAHGLIA